eukprot:CAMPEP_0171085608 /NCGR_PEP_ID=MMETSP0766_2-20121228/19041_1 /TAXON_ID=439317 /ORGANISM="Gambierdiscus australes, Strain CAWD 149" /LENGTH=64 /DNA_ID=CAMNT_0011543195 /DNA_START=71 /DNA_END=261 /DNA_ORIENTATION=-
MRSHRVMAESAQATPKTGGSAARPAARKSQAQRTKPSQGCAAPQAHHQVLLAPLLAVAAVAAAA